MRNPDRDPSSALKFIASMLIFGTIGLFRRHIPFSSGLLAFARGALGGLFLICFLRVKGERIRHGLTRKQLVLLMLGGAAMGINWILLFEAYNYTSVAVATLCYYMQPTIVLLLSPLVFRERITPLKACCAAAALFGMVLVSGVLEGALTEGSQLRGILFGLGAALFYSTVVILNKKAGPANAYEKTVIELFSAAAVMVPYMLLSRDAFSGTYSAPSLLLLLLVGLIHTGIAYVLFFGSMDGLSAQTVAIFSYIDPASALLFSAVLLHEPLTVSGWIGAVLILCAAAACELHGRPES